MKKMNVLIKLAAAVAAVAGIAYLVVKYYDGIKAWIKKLCPCCKLEEDFVSDAEFEPAEETSAEEAAPVEEETPVEEEAPVEEPAPVDESIPVADDSDFEA